MYNQTEIRNKMGDELSRQWYDRRLEALEGKRNVLTFTQGLPLPDVDHISHFDPYWESFSKPQKIIVTGDSEYSRYTMKTLFHSRYKDYIAGFCTPEGNKEILLDDFKVYSIDEAIAIEDAVFIIGDPEESKRFSTYTYLVKYEVNQAKIYIASEFLKAKCGKHYFDLVLPEKNEVFLDCGCLDMSTSLDFYNWCDHSCEKIIAFEPDPVSIERCKQNKEKWNLNMVELVEAAAFNKAGTMTFMAYHSGSSRILETGNITVPTVKIDDVLKGERATFIKMDIETAEFAALEGASETIRKWKPVLAISIYHRKDDILTIPPLIMSLNEDYTLYLRNYSNSMFEGVLYAVPKGRRVLENTNKAW